jgi:hypothetical protein
MKAVFRYAPNIIVADGTRSMPMSDYVAFERGTLDALEEIVKNSWVGYGLIMAIRELSGEIIITPNYSKVCNATAAIPSWKGVNQIEIVYSPVVFGVNSCNGPGFRADEFLLHELVHAYRRLKNKTIKISGLQIDDFVYTNFEEFASILYVNIYMSAKSRGALRKHHLDNTALSPALSTSRGFFQNQKKHARQVHDLICEDYHYCQTYVRKDGGVFNPVDYFLRNSTEVTGMIEWPAPMVADKS